VEKVSQVSEEDITFTFRVEVMRTDDRLVAFGGLVSKCIGFIASCGIQEKAFLV
jgi:hypothetical protein